METQIKLPIERYQMKAKIKEFIDETNEIFEAKSRQMNTLIQSIKSEHNRLLSKSKYFLLLIKLLISPFLVRKKHGFCGFSS